MPLVTRWGSEVRNTAVLEPKTSSPKPAVLDYAPAPIDLPGSAQPRAALATRPKPLKRVLAGGGRRRGGVVQVDPPLSGLDIAGASVIAPPASGLDIDSASLRSPVGGLDIDSASVNLPASGLDIDSASVNLPASGLDIDSVSQPQNLPASGLDIDSASVNSPASGLDIDSASTIAPASGLDIDSASKLTLNIEIVSEQSFADDPNSGETGEIKYSSDTRYLYIHDGTNWHRINGA